MKQLMLLYLVGLIFLAYGVSELRDYSFSIEGPPPTDGLPEVAYSDAASPTGARLETLPSPQPQRSLIYKFYLPAGAYDRLRWTGHGIPLPPEISVRNVLDQEIAVIKTGPGAEDLLATSHPPLLLPGFQVVPFIHWLADNTWFWVAAIVLFLLTRQRLAEGMRRLFDLPAERFRLGPFDGKRALLTVLALTAVWACLLLPGAIRYDVGDDPAMEMLASGYVSGHPSEHLVFVNVLIGFLLKGLYLAAPATPWYPLFLLAVNLLCLTGITWFLLEEDTPDRFCWLCLFGTVFGTYFVMHLQFTSTAFLPGLFGMLVFSRKTSHLTLAVAVLLVVAGSLVRYESLLLLLATTAIAAWVISRRPWLHKLIFFAAILILGWGAKSLDRAYYDRDAGWRAYRQYLVFLGDLHMTPKINFSEKNQPVYQTIGWSKNDFEMFNSHWLYEDPAAFSAEKLSYLDVHLTSNRRPVDLLFSLLVAIALTPVPTLLLLSILLHKRGNSGLSLLMLVAVAGPALYITVDLAYTARLPARVFAPALCATSFFLLIATRENGATTRRLGTSYGLALVFVTLTVASVANLWFSAARNRQATRQILASLDQLRAYPGQTLVGSINAVLLEKLSPFTGQAQTRGLDLIHLMWSGSSPSFDAQLQRHGTSALFTSLSSDPHFWFVIPTSDWKRAEAFSRYMEEHYHQHIRMTPVVLADGKTAVFPNFTVMKAEPIGPP